MDHQSFRQHGHQMVDWIADYLEGVERYPVQSPLAPGEVRNRLVGPPPEVGEPFEQIWADVERAILPGITHWQHPGFQAYFPTGASYPSILGELLSAGLGVQGMLWSTSPACTELESLVLDWLVELMGLPPAFRTTTPGGGVIQDSASSATLCALLAARERASAGEAGRSGASREWVAYTSDQAHSSVEKAVRIAGMGADHLRVIPTDHHFRLDPNALLEAIKRDRAAGRVPIFVSATVGTTSTLAVDPLEAIGPICREQGAWLHVDGAMAGSAALCPEFRWIHQGLEWADSYCFNPHKWLLTNFDCDCFYVADRHWLIRALSVMPEYLRNRASEEHAVIDYRDWQVPLGRRFRALKLWFVLRSYGAAGLREVLRRHVALAAELEARIENHPSLLLSAPRVLSLVCLRHTDGDQATQALLQRINESGRHFVTHTRLNGQLVIRVSFGALKTEERHLESLWELLKEPL